MALYNIPFDQEKESGQHMAWYHVNYSVWSNGNHWTTYSAAIAIGLGKSVVLLAVKPGLNVVERSREKFSCT